jgi:hypothetical protein
MIFYVTPERLDAWNQGEFKKLVAEMRARGVKMHVSLGDDLRQI